MPTAIAAVAAFTAGAAGYTIGSAGFTAVFFATQAVIYTGIGYGFTAIGRSFGRPSTGGAGSPTFSADDIYNTASTIYPIPIGYGKFKMGGNIIYRRTFWGDTRLHTVVALCMGEVESIADPELNDSPWTEMTVGITYDKVVKAYGTLDQVPPFNFMDGVITGTWTGNQFTLTVYDITGFADIGGNLLRATTSAAHYFEEEDLIRITNTANYNGVYYVQAVTSTTFDIIHVWEYTETGKCNSHRYFTALDADAMFITTAGYHTIDIVNSTTLITCDKNGSGNRGGVDKSKQFFSTHGTWNGNIFTRTYGRVFQFGDKDGYFETDAGEWPITEVAANLLSITCGGSSHAGIEGHVREKGLFQAYRGVAYLLLQILATHKLGGNFTVTTIVEGKKCCHIGRGAEDKFEYSITGGSAVSKVFYIADDHATDFSADEEFSVVQSAADENDGDYTVVSSTYNGGESRTEVTVSETVTNDPTTGVLTNFAFTRNPARIIYDFLTKVILFDASKIDEATFRTVRDYCKELVDGNARYYLDIIIDEQESLFDILQNMLTSFCGALIYSEDKIKLIVEKSEASNCFEFTESNIVEETFSFWRPSEPINQLKITYIDSDNEYRTETVIVKDNADIELNGVLEKEISAPFITRTCQAARIAQMLLDKATQTDFICRLTAGFASSVVEVMDVVNVTHSLIGWQEKRFRVLSIEKDEYGHNQFICEAYDGNIYHDSPATTQTSYRSRLIIPDSATLHVDNLSLTEYGYTNEDGTWVSYIKVDFDAYQNIIYWQYANVYTSIDAGTTWRLNGHSDDGIDYRIWGVRPGDTVHVKVVSVNWKGVEVDFDNSPSDSIVLVGKDSTTVPSGEHEYPSNVTGFAYNFDGMVCELYWTSVDATQVQNADLAGYEIRDENANWGTIDAHLIHRGSVTYFTIEEPTANDAAGSNTYYIKAYNTSGYYSQTATSTTPSNAAPANVSGLIATAIKGGVEFRWTASTEKDHTSYYVGLKVASGSWVDFHTNNTHISKILTDTEIAAHGSTPVIYCRVKDEDYWNNSSAAYAETNATAQSGGIAQLTDYDLDIPLLSGVTWTSNSGGINWTEGTLTYGNQEVTVNSGTGVSLKYIYADLSGTIANPLTLSGNNTPPAIGQDVWLFAYWDSVDPYSAFPVYSQHIMHAGVLQALSITTELLAAECITAAKINVGTLSAISADLGTVTAGSLKADTIDTGIITVGGSTLNVGTGAVSFSSGDFVCDTLTASTSVTIGVGSTSEGISLTKAGTVTKLTVRRLDTYYYQLVIDKYGIRAYRDTTAYRDTEAYRTMDIAYNAYTPDIILAGSFIAGQGAFGTSTDWVSSLGPNGIKVNRTRGVVGTKLLDVGPTSYGGNPGGYLGYSAAKKLTINSSGEVAVPKGCLPSNTCQMEHKVYKGVGASPDGGFPRTATTFSFEPDHVVIQCESGHGTVLSIHLFKVSGDGVSTAMLFNGVDAIGYVSLSGSTLTLESYSVYATYLDWDYHVVAFKEL